jgi:hypothetical protein
MKQFSSWEANFFLYMDCLFLLAEARNLGIGAVLTDLIKKRPGNKIAGGSNGRLPPLIPAIPGLYTSTSVRGLRKVKRKVLSGVIIACLPTYLIFFIFI